MPDWSLLTVIIRESLPLRCPPRVPEPDLVMEKSDNVAAYTAAGREAQVMAPTHLLHSAQALELIRPGDTVIDLGCGPGTQLAQLASLAPEARFVGLDLSDEMLSQARQYAAAMNLCNVEFQRADMTDLTAFGRQSVDVAVSSMTLHHLPDTALLEKTFRELARVLKPDGGIYLADFCRLRSPRSMEYFATRSADRQDAAFTRDYLNSLRAAFSLAEFRAAAAPLRGRIRIYRTRPIGLMLAVKSTGPRATLGAGAQGTGGTPVLGAPDSAARAKLNELRQRLAPEFQADLRTLKLMFRLGGLSTTLLD